MDFYIVMAFLFTYVFAKVRKVSHGLSAILVAVIFSFYSLSGVFGSLSFVSSEYLNSLYISTLLAWVIAGLYFVFIYIIGSRGEN